jgi:hypothetical protein
LLLRPSSPSTVSGVLGYCRWLAVIGLDTGFSLRFALAPLRFVVDKMLFGVCLGWFSVLLVQLVELV